MMPRSKASSWNGVDGDHYDDACQIDDFAGVLKRSWGDILVLGDEPAQTTLIVRQDGLALLRWLHAPSEQDLLEFALRWTPEDPPSPVERLSIRLLDEPYILFDSVQHGPSIEPMDLQPPPSARTLTTFVVKDEEKQVGFILHRFDHALSKGHLTLVPRE